MPILKNLIANIKPLYNSISQFLSYHNIIVSLSLSVIFTAFFLMVYYIDVMENAPEGKLEIMITYIPLTFSIFTIFCKLTFVSQGVTSSELGIFKILFSNPIISLYLLILVICTRSHHFMFLILSSGWFISICTLICISILDSNGSLNDEASALSCIIASLISLIFGVSIYIYSRIHRNVNGDDHRIASTALISYSITIIVFMSMFL